MFESGLDHVPSKISMTMHLFRGQITHDGILQHYSCVCALAGMAITQKIT